VPVQVRLWVPHLFFLIIY